MVMHLVMLDKASLGSDDIDFSKLHTLGLDIEIFESTKPEQVADRIRNADIIITNKIIIDASLIEQAAKLKLICISATGVNNIDLESASKNNISVCNVTGYATSSVVQHVFMLITALNTKLNNYQTAVKDGAWESSDFFCLLDFPIIDLSSQAIGIIGYGELGKGVAKLASAFGMKVLIAESLKNHESVPEKRVSLLKLLRESDIVSIHCPLTVETKNLISTNEFEIMKSSTLLINTARGGIIDEAALLSALQDKQIAGAGIDVLETEPPVKNVLLSNPLDNLIITPHIAWASVTSRQRLLNGVIDNIASFLKGNPQNIVNI